jgi:Ca-activated chloride channel family protein
LIFTRLDLLYSLLPLALFALLLKWRRRKNYLTHSLLFYLRDRVRPASSLVHLPRLLEFSALGCLLIALINPVLPSAERLITKKGLDIILILDLSGSMHDPLNFGAPPQQMLRMPMRDRVRSRLDAVKDAMISFVKKRRGDRIGLVVFSQNGYVVAPMTDDIPYLARYLQMVDRNTLAGEGQTAIGEGILSALQLASQQDRETNENRESLLVVFTDGENNTGRDVYAAIQQARERRFRIHFMGIEVERAIGGSRLIDAVRATGGNYYDVRNAEQLEKANQDINRLESGTFLAKREVTYAPRFYPFALASFLLLSASIALRAVPYFIEIS